MARPSCWSHQERNRRGAEVVASAGRFLDHAKELQELVVEGVGRRTDRIEQLLPQTPRKGAGPAERHAQTLTGFTRAPGNEGTRTATSGVTVLFRCGLGGSEVVGSPGIKRHEPCTLVGFGHDLSS